MEAGPGGISTSLLGVLKPEIYEGEFADRICAALAFCLDNGADTGWDGRSLAVFAEILGATAMSHALDELREDIARATRDPKRFNAEVQKLLARHGYLHKSDNKHSRMEPRPDWVGLGSVTLMKTPGDGHGLDNARFQIEAALGLTTLKKVDR